MSKEEQVLIDVTCKGDFKPIPAIRHRQGAVLTIRCPKDEGLGPCRTGSLLSANLFELIGCADKDSLNRRVENGPVVAVVNCEVSPTPL